MRRYRVSIGSTLRTIVVLAIMAGIVLGHSAFAKCGQTPVTSGAATAVADGMDCCPKKPVPPHGSKCPLMALCSFSMAEPTASVPVPAVVAVLRKQLDPADEPGLAGLMSPPLQEPPRSTV